MHLSSARRNFSCIDNDGARDDAMATAAAAVAMASAVPGVTDQVAGIIYYLLSSIWYWCLLPSPQIHLPSSLIHPWPPPATHHQAKQSRAKAKSSEVKQHISTEQLSLGSQLQTVDWLGSASQQTTQTMASSSTTNILDSQTFPELCASIGIDASNPNPSHWH